MGLRCTRYFEMPVVWLQLTSILDELTVEALIEGAGGSGGVTKADVVVSESTLDSVLHLAAYVVPSP